jgi:ADP-dependent phosphofructokinase/glucokinase
MLTKIERNAFYQTPAFKPYEVDFIYFSGFKTLKNKYAHTKYYQEVINECGYFRNYVN